MIRKCVGYKKSIEARSADGRVREGTLFDCGRKTKFTDASLAEADELAAKHPMRFVPAGR